MLKGSWSEPRVYRGSLRKS